MIVKIARHSHAFVIIDKRAAEDCALSYKAKGLYYYLMTRPGDWVVRMEDLQARSTDGRESVQNGMKELRKAGYAALMNWQGEDGKTMGKRWVVAETPDLLAKAIKEGGGTHERETRSSVSPTNGKTVRGETPSTGKPAPTNKRELVKEDGEKLKNGIRDESSLTSDVFELFPEGEIEEKQDAAKEQRLMNAAMREHWTRELLSAYPKKARVQKTAERIISNKLRKYSFEVMMDGVKRYAASKQGTEPQFIASPENFFRDDRFLETPSDAAKVPVDGRNFKPVPKKFLSSEERARLEGGIA